MKVLIADESAAVCERLASMMSELKGIESIADARGCLEAVTSPQKTVPEVVPFDIETHERQWPDALQQIKNSKSTSTLIALTHTYELSARIWALISSLISLTISIGYSTCSRRSPHKVPRHQDIRPIT